MGNTAFVVDLCGGTQVHPHGRGEYKRCAALVERVVGSSPRAWGILERVIRSSPLTRFIPTGVGNTQIPHASGLQVKVHPHGRGEYLSSFHFDTSNPGSSPRAWGILIRLAQTCGASRFIPTGVGNTFNRCAISRARRVHPHGRGEYGWADYQGICCVGSSPRAWGILSSIESYRFCWRFIPTGVGNTRISIITCQPNKVHPHGRGEYFVLRTFRPIWQGSSPRAWGIHCNEWNQTARSRFIPTGVGNTTYHWKKNKDGEVHPHGRGEYRLYLKFDPEKTGSSPRAWGIHFQKTMHHDRMRFIPTGVGNTIQMVWRSLPEQVHPHGRGEYLIQYDISQGVKGSSPRAWGILVWIFWNNRAFRFIPTGVGNTFLQDRYCGTYSVHPHGRGEYQCKMDVGSLVQGSSPRAWGIHRFTPRAWYEVGFIPTGVGNTSSFQTIAASGKVHPHGRGEYTLTYPAVYPQDGSSPRAWGIQPQKRGAPHFHRFIPTGVGNTKLLRAFNCATTVHPHGRGEYSGSIPASLRIDGSSPRAWGIPPCPRPNLTRHGFIPTGVGNTCVLAPSWVVIKVHPHGRGEYVMVTLTYRPDQGSSPRAWGILSEPSPNDSTLRFIPTGVGNTGTLAVGTYLITVHPHGRGEYKPIGANPYPRNGSSPRAWGIHVRTWDNRP